MNYTKIGLYHISNLKAAQESDLKRLEADVYRKRDSMTAFQFKTLNNYIKTDLIEALDAFFSDKRKEAYNNSECYSLLTKNGFFKVHGSGIKTPFKIDPYAKRLQEYECTYYNILSDGYDSMQINCCSRRLAENQFISITDLEKRYANISKFIYDYIVDKNIFREPYGEDYENPSDSYVFYRIKLLDNDLRDVLSNHLECGRIPSHVYSNVESEFRYDSDEKKISYSKDGRKVDMRVGKGIRKLLKKYNISFTDENIKNIVNDLNVTVDDYEFRVVEGESIVEYYNGDKYENNPVLNTGSLSTSCMRYPSCSSYFKVYQENAKMLILVNPETDLIIGRALLWNSVTITEDERYDDDYDGDSYEDEEIMYMDRIYANEAIYPKFKQWAIDNGYFRRRYQSYSSPNAISDTNGTEQRLIMELSFSMNDFSKVPFCDTFAWSDDTYTTNDENFGYYVAQETEGQLTGRDDDDWDDDDY